MCGIAGYAGEDAAQHGDDVRAGVDALKHRGPDGTGWYEDDGIVLGMCRLAIVGLTGGDQPIGDEAGDRIVVCNGEIYNHVELRAELAGRHDISSTSDAAVIPHLYEEDPDGFLRRLRGMFVFALWDRPARHLVLARDRMGKKPLFWSRRLEVVSPLRRSSRRCAKSSAGISHSMKSRSTTTWHSGWFRVRGRSMGCRQLPVASRLDVARDNGRPRIRRWVPPPEEQRATTATGPALLDEIDARLAEAFVFAFAVMSRWASC